MIKDCPYCSRYAFVNSDEWYCCACGRVHEDINPIEHNKYNIIAMRYFKNELKDSYNSGYKYLQGRKLTNETIDKFNLGYSGFGILKSPLSIPLYEGDAFISMGENGEPYDRFKFRVMFPIANEDGIIVGFGGRALGDKKPKYLNSPESSTFQKRRLLYGLNFAKESKKDFFILCEGYLDVISLHQAGFDNAIASLGTALTEYHAVLLKQYGKRVVVAYDNDKPGIKATVKAIKALNEVGIETSILDLSPYNDPDDFIRIEGKNAFSERVKNTLSSDKFLIDNSGDRVTAALEAMFRKETNCDS